VDEISFDGQVAIVTGGGRGLGRGYCLELAARGASVVVNDLPGPDGRGVADDVVAEIEAAGGAAAAANETVSTREGAQAIVRAALDRFGTVDVVVTNAGVMRNGYFEEITPDRLDLVLDVCLRGAFFTAQAAWPELRRKRYGRIVVIGSAGGMFAMQGEANYAAARGGSYGLMKALAFEGAEHGILVNALLPVAPGMSSMDAPVPGWETYAPAGLMERLAPFQRREAVTPMLVYLASRACTLTGEAFSASAGRYARVFVGLTPGWAAGDDARAEDVAAHLDEIRDLDGFTVPRNLYDELEAIADALGVA
jgi:NAD(P)-dependent dehydrogenase (short-subunit alcohol dehydrogenase family)